MYNILHQCDQMKLPFLCLALPTLCHHHTLLPLPVPWWPLSTHRPQFCGGHRLPYTATAPSSVVGTVYLTPPPLPLLCWAPSTLHHHNSLFYAGHSLTVYLKPPPLPFLWWPLSTLHHRHTLFCAGQSTLYHHHSLFHTVYLTLPPLPILC